jgi:hypothetical protein
LGGRYHSRDACLKSRIKLKYFREIRGEGVELIQEQDPMVPLSMPLKIGDFIDQLGNYCFVKKEPVPLSYYNCYRKMTWAGRAEASWKNIISGS